MEGGDVERKINETIRYDAVPRKPMPWNIFETQKFEAFKICCGMCFHLDQTDAIIADRNLCCGMCTRCVWKCSCPQMLRRVEHYCKNCGTLLAIAMLPAPEKVCCGTASAKKEWERTIPDVEKFKTKLYDM